MIRRLLLLAGALALALAAAAPAAAAPDVSLGVEPAAGVKLGQRIDLSGAAKDGAAPLAGRQVRLEVRRFPYRGAWTERATRTTDAQGAFSFSPRFDRNHEVRVRLLGRGVLPGQGEYALPEGDTLSPVEDVFVLPAFSHSFVLLRGRVVRITQVYTVPKDVKLTKATRFYVGPCRWRRGRCTAKRAPLRAVARTKKLRKGRYRARADIKLPKRFGRRFQYVTCFPYSPGSGMGDPDLRCPRRTARLR